MTTAQKWILTAAIGAVVLVAGVLFSTHTFGVSSVNAYEAGVRWTRDGLYVGTTQQFSIDNNGAVTVNATSTLNGIQSVATPVSCVANSAATSTQFAQGNPYGATSTATFVAISGTGQATSTTLTIGTSTASTGRTTSNTSSMFASFTIATSTTFFASPGILVGPGTGYSSPGAASVRTVVVGPSEFVVGTATSTYGNAGALNYTPGLASCAGSIEWRKI